MLVNPKIGEWVIRAKGDYVVGRKGPIVEVFPKEARIRVDWTTASKSKVSYSVVDYLNPRQYTTEFLKDLFVLVYTVDEKWKCVMDEIDHEAPEFYPSYNTAELSQEMFHKDCIIVPATEFIWNRNVSISTRHGGMFRFATGTPLIKN